QGRWTRSAAEEAILALKGRSFPTTSSLDLLEDAFSIAATFDRTVYDSIYVALAVRRKAELVTADMRLANALASHSPVKWLGSVAYGFPGRLRDVAGPAYIGLYVCAPRTGATSLSPRPIRGLFWLLNVAQALLPVPSAWEASALDTGKSACATISRLAHEGFFHRFGVSIHHRQAGARRGGKTAGPECGLALPFDH